MELYPKRITNRLLLLHEITLTENYSFRKTPARVMALEEGADRGNASRSPSPLLPLLSEQELRMQTTRETGSGPRQPRCLRKE